LRRSAIESGAEYPYVGRAPPPAFLLLHCDEGTRQNVLSIDDI